MTVVNRGNIITFHTTYWFKEKAIRFHVVGQRPATLYEWARCLWNADIFFGPVPFLKSVAAVSWAIAWGFARTSG